MHTETLAAILAGEDANCLDRQKAEEAVRRSLSVGSRATTVKTLTDALAKQIEIERKAWDLKDSPPGCSPG